MAQWLNVKTALIAFGVLLIVGLGIAYAIEIQRGVGGSVIVGRVETVDETILLYREAPPSTADLTELNFGTADVTAFGFFRSLVRIPVWVKNGGDEAFSPKPPMDRDGRREDSGRGEGVTGAMIRARIWVDGRLAGGLQALLGAPMAAYSGCGERDGGIGHGKRRWRTGVARDCGDVGLAGGSVADGRRQAGSGMARSRARARLNCSSQGQRRGRCRVNRRAERVIRPAKAKTRRLRVLVVTIC